MKLHAVMRDGVGVPENDAEYVVGPWLTFDPETERCVGEHAEEANVLLKDPNNPGFEIPRASCAPALPPGCLKQQCRESCGLS
jgi:hypothetical protein